MNSSRQTLIGLTRLLALLFAMRGLDSLCTSALVYALRRSSLAISAPQTVDLLPTTDAFYMPLFAVYVVIAIVVWFAAPTISTYALSGSVAEPSADGVAASGPFLIFGTALLIVGYSLERLVDMAHTVYREHTELNVIPYLVLFGLMLLTGIFLITRLGLVYQWIVSKSVRK
ncbi:MAG: hypothetical protein U1F81_22085 [Verrucomicrobiaceae bacterium]